MVLPHNKLRNVFILTRRKSAWLLLLVSLLIGCLPVYWGNFSDEPDNLVIGGLITRGAVLYRDVFSHHFPFPYYWTALVFSLFGKSILIARMSVWAFQIVSFGIALELSGYYLTLGCAAFVWSVIRTFYKGNMVLYNSLCAPSILVIFCITLAILQLRIKMNGKHCLAIGLFSLISILCDPLSVYAIMISLLLLLTADFSKAVKSMGFILAGFACCALILISTSAFKPFIDDALVFNVQIYGKYRDTDPLLLFRILETAIKGLFITDTISLSFNSFNFIATDISFDDWLLTGFIYRFSIIIISIMLAYKNEYRACAFVYLFASALLIVDKAPFRQQPFVMVSLVAVSAVITGEFWQIENNKVSRILQIILAGFTSVIIIWILIRTTNVYIRDQRLFSYDSNFAHIEADARDINRLACGQQDVKLSIYPGSMYLNWFTEMQPATKYLFMFPWVAEIAMNDVIKKLGEKDLLAIVIVEDAVVWEKYYSKQYLHVLFEYLNNNYVKKRDDIYFSMELAKRCK